MNEVWHARIGIVACGRARGRVRPGGEDLAADTWRRLEALPEPRSPQGRIYPLACLVAIAVYAFTAAGNDRFTAVGQWIRRASQADLARLRPPWDQIAGSTALTGSARFHASSNQATSGRTPRSSAVIEA